MATLTIRGLDDEVHARLRVRAAEHGRSMEAEVRTILCDLLSGNPEPADGLGSRIHARFASIDDGGIEEGLVMPGRTDTPRAADLQP